MIVSIAREEITLVTIRYPKQNNEFFSVDLNGQTNGVWTPFLVLPEGNEYANPYPSETLLRAVNGLVGSDFASKEQIDAINFDIPDASILVKTRDGSQIPTQRVLFVNNNDGTYYVKNTNRADVFILESDVVETFILPLDSYKFPEETLP